ncbi:glycosyl hydrolase family 28-related protein [Indiicoccus explosivorum]|uniref:glycosyl hydrolase family 28-related protein n=1 Tax=Indiicoccus explosivorum TaxID=1917864 RepID=UPI000B4338E4|nr:glycosyl hydrolase family 28-related protein [Indiicoccus explosivorum]
MRLSEQHDPTQNEALIDGFYFDLPDKRTILAETDELFRSIYEETLPEPARIRPKLWSADFWLRPFFRLSSEQMPEASDLSSEAGPFPDWKERLDAEYAQLAEETREADVTEFGALGDGKTDCTAAFRRAIGDGGVTVHIPAGVFVVKGIELPDRTRLIGAGKGVTIIRLHDGAPKKQRLITNRDPKKGNTRLSVESMTLDWNSRRLPAGSRTSTGGTASSCLTYANVEFGWVRYVEAVNAGLHGFDITSPSYNYAGDGLRAKNGCRYIWLDGLNASGFGDDGITTHHSDHVLISRSHACDPSGRAHAKGRANANGIEIDDGSHDIWLLFNSTARCFGGIEIKAHHNSSAANSVHVFGHLSVGDNRSYNFRHIGHHRDGDPASGTASNIKAQLLVSMGPVPTELYPSSSPRALVVSAYRNVAVNRFCFIGEEDLDYDGMPAAAVQFKAERVILANGFIEGFRNGTGVAVPEDVGTKSVILTNIVETP